MCDDESSEKCGGIRFRSEILKDVKDGTFGDDDVCQLVLLMFAIGPNGWSRRADRLTHTVSRSLEDVARCYG